jgi:hypothetical protein
VGTGSGNAVSVGLAQPANEAAATVPTFKKSRRCSGGGSFLSGVVMDFRVEVVTNMPAIP